MVARLQRAVARHLGGPGEIRNFQQLTGGANKTTYSFDADVAGRLEPLILQIQAARPPAPPAQLADIAPGVTAEEDARFMIAAERAGVPAPKVRAILDPQDSLGGGYVTNRVEGETLATRILRDDRYAKARGLMARQCGEILAKIHAVPMQEVAFLRHTAAAQFVENQRRVAEFHGLRLPALEWGLRWAAENVPKSARVTPVHGDFRLGNFIVGEEGIRLVLDWEVSMAGDPMQDLGWLCVKTWRFGGRRPVGGFGAREELFEAYEKTSGIRVDPAHVKWWEAFGSVKWAVGCFRLGSRGVEENNVERCAIGRRIEEPLWDFFQLIDGRD